MTQNLRRLWTLPASGLLLPPGHPSGKHIPLPDDWQLAVDFDAERTEHIDELDVVLRFNPQRLAVSAHHDEAVELGPILERYGKELVARLNEALGRLESLPNVSPAWEGVEALARAIKSPGFSARYPSGAKAQEVRGHDLAEVNRILDALAPPPTALLVDTIEARVERIATWLSAVHWVGEQLLAIDWNPETERLSLVMYQREVPEVLRKGLRFALAPAGLGRRNSLSLRLEPQVDPAPADAIAAMARQRLATCALAFERSWDRSRPDFTACVVLQTDRREDRFLLTVQPAAWPLLFPAWLRGCKVEGSGITFEHDSRHLEG